ncbi:hypothetical protein G7Y89_g12647 [Cudoniella acicularis]|uniref:HPP transmembrane region domain-containing protein n=1 Tax=Cudoniella acicularis TaxID=354080 RepID=A0A8H4RAT9_9HELO|nr:hypothetical protein G7Y89_g12647 [Cudoniella acicularis]
MFKLAFDFDIDRYVNRFVPRSRLHLLPEPISRFLGHRSEPRHPIGSVLVWFWSFIGAFCGILVVEAVFHTKTLKAHGTPIVIGSLGAAAILEYHTIESPLSQPRNAILGQTFAAIIGVSITKLFQLNSDFENLRWIAGALSVGLTSAFMGFTKTIHPPAGATALLAATSPDITDLGWFLIPLIMLGSGLMVGVACIINNIQRQYPIYWWTPARLSETKKASDIEKFQEGSKDGVTETEIESYFEFASQEASYIVIESGRIIVPNWISLEAEERGILEILRLKLEGKLRAVSSQASEETCIHNTP